MAIDRIDWHSGGEFPAELKHENGGTHIGMYLAWILINNLYGEIHRESENDELQIKKVVDREISGLDFLINQCDEKLWDDDLNEEGKAFTQFYYADEKTGKYYDDYNRVLAGNLDTLYHVRDSWTNYDKLAPIIDKRFEKWKNKDNRKWWQVWK